MILQTLTSDPLTIILNVIFFFMLFISMFYGTRLQAFRSQKSIENSLKNIKKWNEEIKNLVYMKFRQYSPPELSYEVIKSKIDELIQFFVIYPVDMDPFGLIPKVNHILNIRDERLFDEVSLIAVNASEDVRYNLENLLEAATAINEIHRLLLHYLLLSRKSKNYILLMQVEMQLPIIINIAKSYYTASKAFAEGTPVGDSIGPLVAAQFVRLYGNKNTDFIEKPDRSNFLKNLEFKTSITNANKNADINNNNDKNDGEILNNHYVEIEKNTIASEIIFEERRVIVLRAKGPGGTVGKIGEAIEKIVNSNESVVKRIITVDAGLKLEGDRSGSVIIGSGTAMGGNGVERFKIEAISTEKSIPVDAIICRESLEETICTIRKPLLDSVSIIIDKIKNLIRKYTVSGDLVILAGIGNSIGIGF